MENTGVVVSVSRNSSFDSVSLEGKKRSHTGIQRPE